jgi:hypothetical protein
MHQETHQHRDAPELQVWTHAYGFFEVIYLRWPQRRRQIRVLSAKKAQHEPLCADIGLYSVSGELPAADTLMLVNCDALDARLWLCLRWLLPACRLARECNTSALLLLLCIRI